MSEERNKTEEVEVVSSDQEEITENNEEGKKTIDDLEQDDKGNKKIKNLTALVIILTGIAVGSFFIDIVQLLGGKGYSARTLKTAEVFEAEGKTWVAFSDPKIEAKILTLEDEELESCQNCDPEKVLVWIKRFLPTMVAQKVTASSEEGKKMIEEYGLKTIPSFVFSQGVDQSSFFQEEASVLFEERGDKYVLNSTGMGVPVGKYLETPQVGEGDPVIGNREAEVKIVVFSDHQCPYCSKYFEEITGLAREMGEDVVLTYKDMPLDFHPQARSSALAARCAQEQDRFWEMTKILYATQNTWGKIEGEVDFTGYAKQAEVGLEQFGKCMEEKKYAELVEEDAKEGREFGISGTPSTFINDQFLSGVITKDQLKEIVEGELKKANGEDSSEETVEILEAQ